jgi:DNA-binding phage protein
MPSKKEQFSAKYTLFADAMNAFLRGDFAKGKALLRDYINNTIGFVALAKATGHSSKSLMRMLSPAGNPRRILQRYCTIFRNKPV